MKTFRDSPQPRGETSYSPPPADGVMVVNSDEMRVLLQHKRLAMIDNIRKLGSVIGGKIRVCVCVSMSFAGITDATG